MAIMLIWRSVSLRDKPVLVGDGLGMKLELRDRIGCH